MSIESLPVFAADVALVSAAIGRTQETAELLLEGDAATAGQLSNLRADVTGYRADLRALRHDLDSTDVADLQVHEAADRTIALWTWERELRHALVEMDNELRATDEIATDVALGIRRRIYVVRVGDTLQSIAAQLLGDWREYTRIAEANALTPGPIAAGTVLTLPDRR